MKNLRLQSIFTRDTRHLGAMADSEHNHTLPEMKPLIAVDACFLTDFPCSSLAIYLRGLLKEWDKLENPPEILLLLPRMTEDLDQFLLESPRISFALPDRPAKPASRFMALAIWHQWTIPLLLRKHRPAAYFSPFHFTPLVTFGAGVVTTIHDLCFLAESRFSVGSMTHRIQVISACLSAKKLICVSRHTSAILHHWWPGPFRKSIVVQNGCVANTTSEEESVEILSSECGDITPYRYFIWIGHPSPRKNIKGLLDSFEAYHKQTGDDRRLIIVAPALFHSWIRSLATERRIEESIVLMSNISEATRNALYRCATALVFPSHCEGFGYPVLEAMAQGCPPVSFRHGPSREIVGSTFPLAEKMETSEFCRLMKVAAELNPSERQELSNSLIRRSTQFSMRTMAQKTLAAIQGSI